MIEFGRPSWTWDLRMKNNATPCCFLVMCCSSRISKIGITQGPESLVKTVSSDLNQSIPWRQLLCTTKFTGLTTTDSLRRKGTETFIERCSSSVSISVLGSRQTRLQTTVVMGGLHIWRASDLTPACAIVQKMNSKSFCRQKKMGIQAFLLGTTSVNRKCGRFKTFSYTGNDCQMMKHQITALHGAWEARRLQCFLLTMFKPERFLLLQLLLTWYTFMIYDYESWVDVECPYLMTHETDFPAWSPFTCVWKTLCSTVFKAKTSAAQSWDSICRSKQRCQWLRWECFEEMLRYTLSMFGFRQQKFAELIPEQPDFLPAQKEC